MGASLPDSPIVQPTKFEVVIGQKTAKSLGLTLSPDLLLIASAYTMTRRASM
jgi:hypothetical protein